MKCDSDAHTYTTAFQTIALICEVIQLPLNKLTNSTNYLNI
jgi:hypothetical protein